MSLFSLPPESLLHFVWRERHLDTRNLRTRCGQAVDILHPGRHNHDQGPDFLAARIRLDGMLFHGHVELHVDGDDWYRHGHERDPRYNGCVLHVVFQQSGRPVLREDGTAIPELVIGERLSPQLLAKFHTLQLSQDKLPCEQLAGLVPPERVLAWLDRMGVERLEDKAGRLGDRLERKVQDWEEMLWTELAASMGGPVNESAFRDMAQRLPVKVMKKEATRRLHVEALLFGCSGMLPPRGDEYVESLRAAWDFLRRKYRLKPSQEAVRFLRMRPAAFPTLRLAQLAAIWEAFPHPGSLLEPEGLRRFAEESFQASAYWDERYQFGEPGKRMVKQLGESQRGILLVNVLLPLGWLYQKAHGQDRGGEVWEELLSAMAAEDNRRTRLFAELGWPHDHAFHSQALIHLHKHYCLPRRCLDCHVGQWILRREHPQK